MVASAIGGIATGLVGGMFSKSASDKAASAQLQAAQIGAETADPFKEERGFYQNILRGVYGGIGGGAAGGFGAAPVGGSGLLPDDQIQLAMLRQAQEAHQRERAEYDRQLQYGDVGSFQQDAALLRRGRELSQQIAELEANQTRQIAVKPAVGATGDPLQATGGGLFDWIRQMPQYQFQTQEAERAMKRQAAGTGMFGSGNLMIDLMSRAQQQAAGSFESEINRIMTMAGATAGSPGVAGQIASQGIAGAGATQAAGTQQMLGNIGYGITRGIEAWQGQQQQTPAQMFASPVTGVGQTGAVQPFAGFGAEWGG